MRITKVEIEPCNSMTTKIKTRKKSFIFLDANIHHSRSLIRKQWVTNSHSCIGGF